MAIEGAFAHLAGACQVCYVRGEERDEDEATEAMVTCGADALVKLWEGDEQQEPKLLEYHDEAVRTVAANPKGGKFASASEDCVVKVCAEMDDRAERSGEANVEFDVDGEANADHGMIQPEDVLLPRRGVRRKCHKVQLASECNRIQL